MLKDGAILSEFISGTIPDRENFPKRNRIVAGMSDATIVVESGFKGGSIITADLAMGYNRDVFAIPGRIHDPASEGCNRLIKTNRAALLESVKDLEYIMGWKASDSKKPVQKKIFVELTDEEQLLMDYLKDQGTSQIDEISIATQIPMSNTMGALLNLELNGLVRALPGKKYEIN
jgi:DNA processing protein